LHEIKTNKVKFSSISSYKFFENLFKNKFLFFFCSSSLSRNQFSFITETQATQRGICDVKDVPQNVMSEYEENGKNKVRLAIVNELTRGIQGNYNQQRSIESPTKMFTNRNTNDRDRQVITYDRPVTSKFNPFSTRRSIFSRDTEEDELNFVDFSLIRPKTDVLISKSISDNNQIYSNRSRENGDHLYSTCEVNTRPVSGVATSLVTQKTRFSNFLSFDDEPESNNKTFPHF
jgi:hypothetical protein